jgi:hypothetical protein
VLARTPRSTDSGPHLMPQSPLWNPRTQLLAAFGLYLAVAILVLDRGLLGRSSSYYLGRETDPTQTMWFLKWWLYAISNRFNPFFTNIVWTPYGTNLAWTAFVPLPALVSIPFQITLGEPATYNILITLALPLAAFAAFLLCKRITLSFWPSVLGGYLYGFSPYMLDEARRHLNLVAVFPVPLIVALVLKRLEGGIHSRRFIGILAALLVAQFLDCPRCHRLSDRCRITDALSLRTVCVRTSSRTVMARKQIFR